MIIKELAIQSLPSGSIKLFDSNGNHIGFSSENVNSFSLKSYRSGTVDLDLFYMTSSGNDPKIGIGTTDPRSFFDIKGNTGTEPADIVLRTAKPLDGKIANNDESGRISFVIESSSFTTGKTKEQFIRSGSSAEIFSRIIGETEGAAYGSLIFSVNDDQNTTSPIEALTIGHGIHSGYSGVSLVASGNMVVANEIPVLQLIDTTTGNVNARLGAPNNPGSDWCNLILANAGTTKIQLVGQTGTISASSAITGSDLYIDGWGGISASLAAVGGGSTPTLQQVMDQGSSTTTAITASIVSASGELIGIINGGTF